LSNECGARCARFFFDFRVELGERFASLFGGTGEEAEGVSMNSKWGWYNTLFALSNNILDIDKITKLPIMEVLTYLAYRQDYGNKQRNNYDNF